MNKSGREKKKGEITFLRIKLHLTGGKAPAKQDGRPKKMKMNERLKPNEVFNLNETQVAA